VDAGLIGLQPPTSWTHLKLIISITDTSIEREKKMLLDEKEFCKINLVLKGCFKVVKEV
jgi:hypothetical protein